MGIQEKIKEAKQAVHIRRKIFQDYEYFVKAKEEALLQEIESMKARFKTENKNLLERYANAEESLQEADANLRTEAIRYFNETGEKVFDRDVSVRVTTSLEYDEDEAFGWAMEHKMCLKLDTPAFKKVASATKPGFVAEVESITAVLAKEFKDIEPAEPVEPVAWQNEEQALVGDAKAAEKAGK